MESQKFPNSLENMNCNTEETNNNSLTISQSCNTIADEQMAVLESNLSRYSDIVNTIQPNSSSQAESEHGEDALQKLTDDEKNKRFVEIKLWEETRVEKYQLFVNAIDPIFAELSDSISQAMKTNKELASILQQKAKFWSNYSKSLELIPQHGAINCLSNSHTHNSSNPCLSCSSNNYSSIRVKSGDLKKCYTQDEELDQARVNGPLKEPSKSNSEITLPFGSLSGDMSSISGNLLGSISSQKVWPSLLASFGKYESVFLRKLCQSVETDVVNGHLSWISKRYFNNAQAYLKALRAARKGFEVFINNTQQSWNKYDDAFKRSQRLSLDINYSLKSCKPCDTWYIDQIYRHNVSKFIQAQEKFFDALLVTVDNLMELENWRATSVKLTLNYFLVKQNELFGFLQKLGNSMIDFINDQSQHNSFSQDHCANFDIITSIPGLKPPPIPISSETNFSKVSQSLANCPALQQISSLMEYNNLPKSSLIIYHGHVEIFKRKVFLGQWQSAYLILTKDKFLYLLNPKDDIEMEELLKHDERPIWSFFVGSPDISIQLNEKRGKRCLSIKFKKQKLFTKKLTIRCSNEEECNKWINHLNSTIPS